MERKEIGRESVDRIYVAPDRVQWRAFVNTVMNYLGGSKAVTSSSERPSDSQECLSMWLISIEALTSEELRDPQY
jgi:hypothetical protein